jgi:RNA-binding protein Musashi
VDDRDFRQYFDAFGTIVDCQIMLDHNTQRSRGFGFVTYDSPGPVDDIMRRADHSIKGKEVKPGRISVCVHVSYLSVAARKAHSEGEQQQLTPEATRGGVGRQVEIKRAFPRGADVNRQSLAPPPGRGGPMSRGGGGYDRGGYDRLLLCKST